ncbi:MAG: hypothetical protein ACLFTK_10500, partial [Anaerolineales bacterium]
MNEKTPSQYPDFEDLTLWEVLRLFIFRPGPVLRVFFKTISAPPSSGPREATPTPRQPEVHLAPESLDIPPPTQATPPVSATNGALPDLHMPEETLEDAPSLISPMHMVLSFILFIALLLAIFSGQALWSAVENNSSPTITLIIFIPAAIIYSLAMLYRARWWWLERLSGDARPTAPTQPQPQTMPVTTLPSPAETPLRDDTPSEAHPLEMLFNWVENNALRLALMPLGIVFAYLAYSENVLYDATGTQVQDVVWTTPGTIAWLLAIITWFAILTIDLNRLAGGLYTRLIGDARWPSLPRLPRPQLRALLQWGWVGLALMLIAIAALYMRLDDLSGVPPEMTSDHIEKLLDARRVYLGYEGIFFPNNGGREGFQMHYIAALINVFGLDFSFDTLKLATIIEGLVTIALSIWLGRVVIGHQTPEQRRMGLWLGLCIAALLAVSHWHVMLSRLGLRIALTPLVTVLVLIFLVRGMRHNRRFDFVVLGIVLGAGVYFYQANRMLPLLAITGTVLGAAIYARSWGAAWRYALNLGATGIMAIVIFLPLYRYGEAFPDQFWNRTQGRLFGDNAFIREDPETGMMVAYDPSFSEQFDLFIDQWDVFQQNYWDALRMWSWRGDAAWINNPNQRPALDPVTNGLFLLGILAWVVLIVRRWDAAHILVPLGVLVMLLPSALTLAYTIENPSFTRASGTIPFVFLVAAYPLAQFAYFTDRAIRWRNVGALIALIAIALVVYSAGTVSHRLYFEEYQEGYRRSWTPYAEIAEPLNTFATGEGNWGNAFMIAYPHWLDHRILGTVAGDIDWNNGLVTQDQIFAAVQQNAGTPYAYDPTRPLFIMYHQDDTETAQYLETAFPEGES